jgi:hypothetical protein
VVGDNQTATVSTAVPVPPAVRLVDAHGNPIAGRTVTFSAGAGGGSVTGETRVTGADGIAAVGAWQLGTMAGPQSLFASVAFLPPVLFNATATPGQPAALSKKSTDGQTTVVASVLTASVQVTDAHGNGVAGITVTFSVSSGGGSVNTLSTPTGDLGNAVTVWTLGKVPGPNALTASAPGLPTLTFTATTVAGPPARITKEAGDAQKASPGSAVAVPPSVRVTDVHGNPTPGVQVTFAVVEGGGQVTGATPTTNASGVASVGSWTLGSTGTNALKASVSSTISTTFTASGGTLVSGVIQSNTTWSAAESPYQLTGDVKIEYGATLTIEPGVTVIGSLGPNGFLRSLNLWGTLSAVGTAESPIVFRDVRFAGWGMTTGQAHKLVIEHAEILGGILYPRTNDSYGSIVLRDSKIRNTGDQFNNVTYIHFPSADCFIERNSFFNAQTISTGTTGPNVYIRNNTFRATSITNEFSHSGSKTIVEHNSFLTGLGSMVRLSADESSDVIAINNWWGTTNESEIEEMIYDKKDAPDRPRFIVYSPFLTAPHHMTPP